MIKKLSNNKQLEAMLDTIHTSVLIIDTQLVVYWANQTFLETFRIKSDSIEGCQIYQICCGEWDIPELRVLLEHTLKKQHEVKNYKIVYRFKNLGKRILIINAQQIFFENQKQIFYFLSILDISEIENMIEEQKDFQDAIEIEKMRLKSVIDSIPEAVVLVDENSRIFLANPAARKLYNRPVPYGKSFEHHEDLFLCYPDGSVIEGRDLPLTRSALDGQILKNIEATVTWPDGQKKDLLINSAPIINNLEKAVGAVCIIKDITEIKETGRERLQLLKQVETYAVHLQELNEQLKSQAEELLNQKESLKKAQEELEIKVKERTIDLHNVNKALKEEIGERKQAEKAVKKSEKQLRFLSSKLIDTQENERKLIAQELHDSIGTSLTAIKYAIEKSISQFENKLDKDELLQFENIIKMVRNTVEETRRISTNLRPSIIDDIGIVPTIGWHCREFKKIYDKINISTEIDIQEGFIPEPLKIVIYRIVQESMNNIIKHSDADSIYIFFHRQDGSIILKVKDNGKGFDVDQFNNENKECMGITSMIERTEFTGGFFSIESQKNKGTIICAKWPDH